jgi:hypothetical protein
MINMQTVNFLDTALRNGIVAYFHGKIEIVVFPFPFAAIFKVLGIVTARQGISSRA